MVEPSGMGSFKNKMKAFFYDCPYLVKKIEDNTYKRKHITEMIEDYTKNCVKAEKPDSTETLSVPTK